MLPLVFFLMCIQKTAIDTEYFELQSITLPMPLPPITITSKKKKTHVQRTHRVWHEVPQNADRCLQKDVQRKKEKEKKKKKNGRLYITIGRFFVHFHLLIVYVDFFCTHC